MNIINFIKKKREGETHTEEEMNWFVQECTKGHIQDYQISAWLMAGYLKGLTPQETAWLTVAMANSGKKLDLSSLPKPWLDKHSTGGVGDKTTIVVLPILAACGLTMVKMSGKGLGITGGTVDKLNSIPGFRTELTPEQMLKEAADIGIALSGQSPNLAPADKIFYALRDTTATVSSIPFIVSSILSKKMAGGAETIVLDVKCGSGAFMKTKKEAANLAKALQDTAKYCGLKVSLAMTDMDQPLGNMVGHTLEIKEVIRTLKDAPDTRFTHLCTGLSGLALYAAGKTSSIESGKEIAREALSSKKALNKAKQWISAQGGPQDLFEIPDRYLPPASVIQKVEHNGESCWVKKWDAEKVGQVVVELGGGRIEKEDQIDYSVGLQSFIEVGSKIEKGSPLFHLHAKNQKDADMAVVKLKDAIVFSSTPVEPTSIFLEVWP